MKKSFALLLLLCTFVLVLSSCGSRSAIAKPEDTNLEYWLFDEPDEENLTLVRSGGSYKMFLASGYEDVDVKYTCQPNAVYYNTTKTSIALTNRDRISQITITDPEVTLWGLTINSTHDEFYTTLTQVGFEETYWSEEFGYSSFEFKDSKRIYTIDVRYGSGITIYCMNRDYVDEFCQKAGVYTCLTKLYIWLEEDVF